MILLRKIRVNPTIRPLIVNHAVSAPQLFPQLNSIEKALRFLRRACPLGAVVLATAWMTLSAYAAPLTFVENPVGSGLYSVLVNDTFSATGVASADDWEFEGEIGDLISIRLEAVSARRAPRCAS